MLAVMKIITDKTCLKTILIYFQTMTVWPTVVLELAAVRITDTTFLFAEYDGVLDILLYDSNLVFI